MAKRPQKTRTTVAIAAVVAGACLWVARREGRQFALPAKPVTESEKEFVAANTQFAFDLFAELRETQPEENVFVSPESVALALAMTYNGAAGETKEAMAEALSLGGLSLSELNAASAALSKSLKRADRRVGLSIANSL